MDNILQKNGSISYSSQLQNETNLSCQSPTDHIRCFAQVPHLGNFLCISGFLGGQEILYPPTRQ